MRIFCIIYILLIYAPLPIFSQHPDRVIEINGRLIQKSGTESKGIPGVNIVVGGKIKNTTDNTGNFHFKHGVNNDNLQVDISPRGYRILRPNQGLIDLFPAQNTMFVEILVCNNSDILLNKQIDNLNEEVNELRRQNKLSKRQIRLLEEKMVDTLLFYQQERLNYEHTIHKISQELSESQQQNQALSDTLRFYQNELETQKRNVERLSQQLFEALEAKFLRQQAHYTAVSSSLQNYLDRLKDLRDWLPTVEDYFTSTQAQQDFMKICNAYSAARDHIANNRHNYISAVRNDWESAQIVEKLEKTMNFLMTDVHDDIMLKDFNNNVIDHLKAVGSGRLGVGPGRKKAKEGAADTLKKLNPLILELESRISSINNELRKSM